MNTELFPILVDKLQNAQLMEQKYAKQQFPIYYDPAKMVANMLHQEVRLVKLGRMPGLLVVDKQGIIRYAYYSEGMSDIPSNEDVFEILEQLEGKKRIRSAAEN